MDDDVDVVVAAAVRAVAVEDYTPMEPLRQREHSFAAAGRVVVEVGKPLVFCQ